MKYLGVSYYPESWGIDRVAVDIKLMKDAGINMVRMGEFAWSKMEKLQGEYDFELFHKAVDMFAENNIDVMMCTPTAAPPAWLTYKYPETLMVNVDGIKAFHGIRQQCCYNSILFRNFSSRITDELTINLANCTNIPIWQIDNELGQRLFGLFCHCEGCQKDFREYLRARYKTLDNLNHHWGNEFWSQDYSDWNEIRLAFLEKNLAVSRVLDSMRFFTKTVDDFMRIQKDIIHKNIPQAKITTNNPVGCLDLYKIYQALDVASGDFYWDNRNPAQMALRLSTYRSFKKKEFFIAETGLFSEIYSDSSIARAARLDMWRSFAHGSISYLIFLWRPFPGGQEQAACGLVSPSGKPRRNYQIAKMMFTEAKTLEKELENIYLPKAQVALMLDTDVDKAYMRHGWGNSIKYNTLVENVFEQMHMRNIGTDVISPNCTFEQYKLLILPSQRIAYPATIQRIKEFIRSGGVVWALAECHTADENANFMPTNSPNGLTEEFGVNIEFGASSFTLDGQAKTVVSGKICGRDFNTEIPNGWIADIDLLPGTECLLRFSEGYYQGQPAVTCNRCENGYVIYQGISNTGPDLLHEIAQLVVDKAKIDYCRNLPDGIEIIDCCTAVFIINNNSFAVKFKYPVNGTALLGNFNRQAGIVELKAFDLCIIKLNKKD